MQQFVAANDFGRDNTIMNALSPNGDAPQSGPWYPQQLAEPIYFEAGSGQLFGCLHRTNESELGVVLCNPFGYEAICAHRGVRTFAEAIAGLGVPALRFDYTGTGDSSDLVGQTDQIEVWTADIQAAVSALRRLTGVKRVCLVGFRLGALLAVRTASEPIDALVLIAPVISGRRYVRELRIAQMAAALRDEDTPAKSGEGECDLEVAGFSLSASSISTLQKVDLERISMPSLRQVLIIDRPDLPTAKKWTELAVSWGADAQYCCLPGSVEMFSTAPQYGSVADAMVRTTGEWISQRRGACSPSSFLSSRRGSPVPPALSLAGEQSGIITERPVFFGNDTPLFGIISEPQRAEPASQAIILLNAAADPHYGAGRVYVSLARSWARKGYIVLRMDLAGIGDSATRAERANDEVFSPDALADIRAAASFLESHYKLRGIVLGGLCSGGYHALRAAVAGMDVRQIFLVNPENYYWKQGTALEDVQLAEALRNPGIYRERVQSAMAWQRLLTGRVNVWRILKIYAQRARLAVESALRDTARSLRIRLQSDLGSELEGLSDRGVQVAFVFAQGEPGLPLLKLLAGSTLSRLSGSCHVHLIDGGDHTFSTRGPREACEALLTKEIDSVARSSQVPRISAADGAGLRVLRERP